MKNSGRKKTFVEEISSRAGTNVSLCWHCKCCSGGCPFSDDMDYHPNQVLRLVQMGLKDKALGASGIWICVGCHTCSMECPQGIDIAAVMDALRQMAVEEGVQAGEPDILRFHDEVLKSIFRYGRTHKIEIMLRYKLRTRSFFNDVDIGIKMLKARKLDLLPSKVKGIDDVRRCFTEDTFKSREDE